MSYVIHMNESRHTSECIIVCHRVVALRSQDGVCVCVCVCVCMRTCVFVCVGERERESTRLSLTHTRTSLHCVVKMV